MRLRKFLYYGAIAAFFVSIVASPARVVLKGLVGLTNDPTKHLESISGAEIAIFDKRQKRTIKLNIKKNVEGTTKSIFLQGKYRSINTSLPAAADVISGKVRITFPGRLHGSRKSRQRMYKLTATLAEGEVVGRLSSVPSSIIKAKTCDETQTHAANSKDVEPMVAGMATNQSLVATIHTYADAEFVDLYGASTGDEMASIVNAAEAIYSAQLGIRFRIVGRTKFVERTPETVPGEILATFLNRPETKNDAVDLKHLFTGKDMDGTTIGIAFVGAVCYEPSYSYGVSQDYGFSTPYIFAHEIGHNFGALHDTAAPGSVMYPSIPWWIDNAKFSQTSINQITQHVISQGSCLDVEQNGPDLTKAKITINRINRLVYGKIVDESGAPIAGLKVLVYVNGSPKELVTNKTGSYYTVLKSGRRQFVVYSTIKQSAVRSRTLRFRA